MHASDLRVRPGERLGPAEVHAVIASAAHRSSNVMAGSEANPAGFALHGTHSGCACRCRRWCSRAYSAERRARLRAARISLQGRFGRSGPSIAPRSTPCSRLTTPKAECGAPSSVTIKNLQAQAGPFQAQAGPFRLRPALSCRREWLCARHERLSIAHRLLVKRIFARLVADTEANRNRAQRGTEHAHTQSREARLHAAHALE